MNERMSVAFVVSSDRVAKREFSIHLFTRFKDLTFRNQSLERCVILRRLLP